MIVEWILRYLFPEQPYPTQVIKHSLKSDWLLFFEPELVFVERKTYYVSQT